MRKKGWSLLIVLVLMICYVSSCSRGTKQEETTDILPVTQIPEITETLVPFPTEEPEKLRDLNGFEIIIGDTYSLEVTRTPENAMEQLVNSYREDVMQKYNFTISTKKVADLEEMEELYINSVLEGKPAAQVFELDYRLLAKPLALGLLYDLATLEEFDFSNKYKWCGAVKEVMTKGDSVYGMRATQMEPGGGVLWNKRLFAEVGLDPDLPYDLQARGEWTWSKFEELCAILTRDTDRDGQTDVYATCSDGTDTLQCLVSSTGKDFFAVDEEGTIYNNCKDDDVLGAMKFAAGLYEKGYEMPAGEESDWYISAFQDGKAAMQFGEEALCKSDAPYGENCMTDAVGFVLPPKPDGQEEYHSYVYGNVWVIPSCYDAEIAANIAFAYNLYTQQVPGYESLPEDYLDSYYFDFYRKGVYDERAVTETIQRYNYGETASFLTSYLVDGLDIRDLTKHYPFVDCTPEECVEQVWDFWQEVIDICNGEESA